MEEVSGWFDFESGVYMCVNVYVCECVRGCGCVCV